MKLIYTTNPLAAIGMIVLCTQYTSIIGIQNKNIYKRVRALISMFNFSFQLYIRIFDILKNFVIVKFLLINQFSNVMIAQF